MNKRRLLKLADLLVADAKNKKGVKFDLNTWAAPADRFWDRCWETKTTKIKVDCSTSACAIGLACISGAFARSGLSYGFIKLKCSEGFHMVPKFKGSKEFKAVQKFFDITLQEAEFLFSPAKYPFGSTSGAPAERSVAKRIRKFVDGKFVCPTE